MLKYDPLDFVTVLECEPLDYDEVYGATIYEVERNGLVLSVHISSFHSSLQIDIHKEGNQLMGVVLYIDKDVKRFYEKGIEYLIATDCSLISNWWSLNEVANRKDYGSGQLRRVDL